MPPKLRVGELSAKIGQAVALEVRAACRRRGSAAAQGGGRRELTPELVQELEQRVVLAASYAALGCVPNKVARVGAPPDNARIILLHDIRRALTDLGLSGGAHFVPPHQSLAVELYSVVARRVWENNSLVTPRSTFRRMKAADISN